MSTPNPPAPPAAAPAPDRFPFTPKWKAVGPTAAVLGLIILFNVFFLDMAVRRGIEKAGTAANGAKVELDRARVSLLHFSITLSGLRVADAEEPMTNSVEIATLRLKLAPKPLTWKKIIIEDASIEGIRTGTPRKTSGALSKPAAPAAGPSLGGPAAAAAPDKSAGLGLEAWQNLKEKFDPKKIQAEDLASYKRVKEEQVHLQALADTWNARVDAVKTDDLEARVKAFTEKVKGESFSGAEGLKKAQALLKEAKSITSDAEATKNGFNALKKDLTAEIDRSKDSLKEIDALRKKDVDGAIGDVKAAVSVEGVTEGLLGPQYAAKLRSALGWIRKVRAMIPRKKGAKEEKAPPPIPRRGEDVLFPFHYKWPVFHLVKSTLSGETEGGLAWSGTLKDVASDPKMVGRPAVLDVKGERGRQMSLHAELDARGEPVREKVEFNYGGMKLDGMTLGNLGAPITVKNGTGRVRADIEGAGETVSGAVLMAGDPIALSHALSPEQAKNKMMSLLHDTLSRINKGDVTFKLSGKLASPDVKVASSIDGQVKAAVQAAVQKELDDMKARAAARVSDLVGGEQKKLADAVNGKSGEALQKMGLKDKQVAKAQDAVRKAMDDVQKKGTASVLPAGEDGKPKLPGDLKKLFKKR